MMGSTSFNCIFHSTETSFKAVKEAHHKAELICKHASVALVDVNVFRTRRKIKGVPNILLDVQEK